MNIKILLVDTKENNSIASLNLTNLNYEIYTSNNINQAFLFLENQKIDVILLNIDEQNSEELEFCKSIKNNFSTDSIPIIVLVKPNNINIIIQALNLGAEDYITFPINEEDLKLKIAVQTIRKKKSTKSKNHYNKEDFHAKMNIYHKNALNSQKKFSIIMIDLDNFKEINDTYGHLTGDEALKETEKRFSQSLRDEDILAKFGGDEFIIMLPTNLDNAYLIGERLRKNIEQTPFCNKRLINITASFGITEFNGTEELEEIINRADKALYMAKKQNKNKVIKLAQ